MTNLLYKLLILYFLVDSAFSISQKRRKSKPSIKQYTWVPQHNMDQASTWLNGRLPCDDDTIAFDEQKLAVSFIKGGLKTSDVLLPDDGIIFMDSYTIIGDKADWQCPKRSPAGEVFFEPSNALPNVFDGNNWKMVNDNGRAKLHCRRVPSQEDEAIFPLDSASRAEIDAVLIIGRLNYSNQYLTNANFIYTMEGQLMFSIGPKLMDRIAIDNVSYQMPNTEVIRVMAGPISSPKGLINSNAQEPQFTEICRHVQCPDWTSHCSQPVKPFGHCCPICGVMATFHHPAFCLKCAERFATIMAEKQLPKSVGLEISRLDKTAVMPKYQIAVITDDMAIFDENTFYTAVTEFYNQMLYLIEVEDAAVGAGSETAALFTGYEVVYSLQTGKIRLRSVLEVLLFVTLVSTVIGVYLRYLYKTSPRFRLLFSSRDIANRMTVVWQNAKEFAEDKVEVIMHPPEPVIHAFAHYRNVPDPFEEASNQPPDLSDYSAEFRNPTFIEYTPEELEAQAQLSEVKEEKLFDLDI